MRGGEKVTEFERIYKEYFNDVFLYIRKVSNGNEALAEEITSETFFKAMRTLDSFRGDCDLRVWLCQIAKNCYYSYCRKNRRIQSFEEMSEADVDDKKPTLEELIIYREEAANIRYLLHDLEEPYKEVFMWRVFGELSFRQIGIMFQKTENWACVTFHRARRMIQNRMEDEDYEK